MKDEEMIFGAALVIIRALIGKKAPKTVRKLLGRTLADDYKAKSLGRVGAIDSETLAEYQKLVKKIGDDDERKRITRAEGHPRG